MRGADSAGIISELRPYAEYKDSGRPWLGKVPGHWTLARSRTMFTKADRPVRPEDEVVTCFRDGTVTLRKNRRLRGYTEAIYELGYQGIRRGDLVIHAMDAFAGAVGVSDSDGKGSPIYGVCIPKSDANPHYYAHVVREMSRTQWILALARGIRERSTDFRFESFATQFVPVPPPAEQAGIVRFLTAVDRRVNRFVRAKRRLIELLNEQKQALITHAVTRGLDPNAKLKPSGIDWLGDVPEHWEVKRLKLIGEAFIGLTYSPADLTGEAGTLVLRSSNIRNGRVVRGKDVYVRTPIPPKLWVRPDDLLICSRNGSQELVGKCALITEATVPASFGAFMTVFRSAHNAFLYQVMQSRMFAYLQATFETSTINQLTLADLNSLVVPIPPADEQREIVSQICSDVSLLVEAIGRAEREIALLREYRTRLVADVVTGKLDVRAAAAHLPDDTADPAEALVEEPSTEDGEESSDAEDAEEELADAEA